MKQLANTALPAAMRCLVFIVLSRVDGSAIVDDWKPSLDAAQKS
jgi:hypothetical protein